MFQSLLIGSTNVEKIVSHKNVAAVTVTGSTSTGRIIAKIAGGHLKKVVLELGGNDPFILSDANLENAIEQAIKARMLNTGQSCIAAKRFIVVKDVFDQFAFKFSEKVEHLIIGNPLNRSTEIDPLAKRDILNRLVIQVNRSIKKGAKVLIGGKQIKSNPGYYYTPIVLQNVKRGMPVYHEETFGPVARLIKVQDEKEAMRIANDTKYGLGASIWTSNIKRGTNLAQSFQSGAVFINEIVKSDPRLPFGGIKESGYGRELSYFGIKEFVNIQTIYVKKS